MAGRQQSALSTFRAAGAHHTRSAQPVRRALGFGCGGPGRDRSGEPMRVLVLYCEEGEGHASAASALERELALETGAEVIAWDAFKGGLGRLIPFFSRDLYRVQVRRFRWTYG